MSRQVNQTPRTEGWELNRNLEVVEVRPPDTTLPTVNTATVHVASAGYFTPNGYTATVHV